jgi:hypothetical protein
MARPKANLVVLDPGSGKARPGAFVTIYRANTLDLAALFADDDVTSVANPIQANGLGQVSVRLNPGLYDVSMTWDGAQPTVVEDITVITGEVVITSPGDLIIGNADGLPSRLAVGTNGQVLFVENGLPAWKTLGSGVGLPVGPPGSLLSYGPGGAMLPILPGLQDQALAMMGGVPTWVSTLLPPGTTLPINQPGDLVVGAVTTGLPARLARGAAGDVLQVDPSGGLVWANGDSIGPGGGYCVLDLVAAQIVLKPWQGNQVWIDGRPRGIPNTGTPGLTTTGLTANTTYYIYAAWTGTAVALEASTTAWAELGGLTHKAGDPTRTLVGMARTGSGPSWVDSPHQRFLLSFFYPSVGSGTAWLTAPRSLVYPPVVNVEVHPEIRVEFLCWGWAQTLVTLSGTALASAAGVRYQSNLSIDGLGAQVGTVIRAATAYEWTNISTTFVGTFTEGYHYATLFGVVDTAPGTVTWWGDVSGSHSCRIHTLVVGAG